MSDSKGIVFFLCDIQEYAQKDIEMTGNLCIYITIYVW
jgi:hypothetical protein